MKYVIGLKYKNGKTLVDDRSFDSESEARRFIHGIFETTFARDIESYNIYSIVEENVQ